MVGCVPSACDGVPSAGLGQAPGVLMGWSLPALRQRGSWHDLPTTLLGSVIVPPRCWAVKPALGLAAGAGKSSLGAFLLWPGIKLANPIATMWG